MITFLVTKLLFFPVKPIAYVPSQFDIPYEEVRFKNEEGLLLHGWFIPGHKNQRTLLYLHGNAGNMADRLEKIKLLQKIGWNIFIIDYRGYGGSEGSPTIEGVQRDADASYEWLISGREEIKTPPEQIIVWGESLGGALATDLASRKILGGLILQSTFTSLREIGKTHYPFIPTSLVPDSFRSIEKIKKIRSPLLLIHGNQDETVPFEMGKRLFKAAPHPKRFYEVDGGTHNESYRMKPLEYLGQIEEFLTEAGL